MRSSVSGLEAALKEKVRVHLGLGMAQLVEDSQELIYLQWRHLAGLRSDMLTSLQDLLVSPLSTSGTLLLPCPLFKAWVSPDPFAFLIL